MPVLNPLPSRAGIGLKPEHYAAVLSTIGSAASPAWVEVHPQNYFGAGGLPHHFLRQIAAVLPVSFHSVGLSLGSANGVNPDELHMLAALCAHYAPSMISDHLSWSDAPGRYYPDLMPLPYTWESLDHFARQVDRVQTALRRRMLIENPSRYLGFADDDLEEPEFLDRLCRMTGCGLLLDINNVFVSAVNTGFDPLAWLDAIDPFLVSEIHMAGHHVEQHDSGPLLIDDHGSCVADEVWALLEAFIARAGPRPVLIEWDTHIPDFSVLMKEADKADTILARAAASQVKELARAG